MFPRILAIFCAAFLFQILTLTRQKFVIQLQYPFSSLTSKINICFQELAFVEQNDNRIHRIKRTQRNVLSRKANEGKARRLVKFYRQWAEALSE